MWVFVAASQNDSPRSVGGSMPWNRRTYSHQRALYWSAGKPAYRSRSKEVMTPAAYEHLEYINSQLIEKCDAICAKYGIPGYTVGIGSKGCVNFSSAKVTDYESFMANQDMDLCSLAWLYNINRGVIMAAGREEEWTLSISHNDEDVERYVSAFEDLARDVTS